MDLSAILILLAVAAAAMAAVMSIAWLVQRATGNSGWIDVFWSFGIGLAAVFLALVPLSSSTPRLRNFAVALLIALWSSRLGIHILRRTRKVSDDPRYRALLDIWGAGAASRLFWQLQAQGAVGTLLLVSVALAAWNPVPFLRAQDVVAAALLLAGIIGEAVADRQLELFKKSADRRPGAVCDAGLWRCSRHPNYFFEWLCWCAWPVMACDLTGTYPFGWLALSAPAVMYWALVHVSGLPPLEAHMLRSRGEAFRAYQKRTSPFFPRPPRH